MKCRSIAAACCLAIALSSWLPPLSFAAPATAPTTAPSKEAGGDISQKEIDALPFENFANDRGFVCPVSPGLEHLDDERRQRLNEWLAKAEEWGPGTAERSGSVGQRVRNLLTLCAMADMGRSDFEGETAYVLFDELRRTIPKDELARACAWVILRPKEGIVITAVPELGFDGDLPEEALRERTGMYGIKLLGRVLGKFPGKDDNEEVEGAPATRPASGPATRQTGK